MGMNIEICSKNNVDYLSVRKAMCQNARTKEEVAQMTGVCLECEGCRTKLDGILSSVCGCNQVSLKAVVDSVNNGAYTTEQIINETKAGATCGRCKVLVENIIEIGR